MSRGSTCCCKTDASRGSTSCYRDTKKQHRLLRVGTSKSRGSRMDTSVERTRWCRTDSFRDKMLKHKAEFSACFGWFRFVSVNFGFTETPKLGVSLWKRNKWNKHFISDSATISFDSSFGCFKSKLVSKDTLGQTHYKGHWKGWALKIETFLGSEIALQEPFGPTVS